MEEFPTTNTTIHVRKDTDINMEVSNVGETAAFSIEFDQPNLIGISGVTIFIPKELETEFRQKFEQAFRDR